MRPFPISTESISKISIVQKNLILGVNRPDKSKDFKISTYIPFLLTEFNVINKELYTFRSSAVKSAVIEIAGYNETDHCVITVLK